MGIKQVGTTIVGTGAVTSVQGTSTVIATRGATGTVTTVVDTLKGLVPVDLSVLPLRAQGAGMCNLVQYMTYMQQNPDNVADLNSRVNAGLAHGAFVGTLSTKIVGGLSFLGQDWNWGDLAAQAKQ